VSYNIFSAYETTNTNDGLFISPTKETSLCNSDFKNDFTRCSGAQFETFSIMFGESKETSHLAASALS